MWTALDEVEADSEPGVWAGGQKDAEGVIHMPYVVYSEAARRFLSTLGGVGAVVVFDWMNWHRPDRIESAADAARTITAVVRGDRFSEGTLLEAITDGTLAAAVAQLRRWYDGQQGQRTGRPSR